MENRYDIDEIIKDLATNYLLFYKIWTIRLPTVG